MKGLGFFMFQFYSLFLFSSIFWVILHQLVFRAKLNFSFSRQPRLPNLNPSIPTNNLMIFKMNCSKKKPNDIKQMEETISRRSDIVDSCKASKRGRSLCFDLSYTNGVQASSRLEQVSSWTSFFLSEEDDV